MRIRRLISFALAAAFCVAGATSAGAFSTYFLSPTQVYPEPKDMASYGGRLHREIMLECYRSARPFRLKAPVAVLVVFSVDRRGALVDVDVPQKSRSKLIDDYMMAMVRQAARRFPPAPVDMPSDPMRFTVPIYLRD